MRLLFDAHLDLAWNALSFNRDQTLSVEEIRRLEAHMTDEPCRGGATTSLPELRQARAAVVVATLLARGGPDPKRKESYLRSDLDFATQSIAHATAHGQLSYYRLLEAEGHLRMIRTASELDSHWREWQRDGERTPIGYVLSMEGADPIVRPAQADGWWKLGLRAAGPAHYGRSHYAYGTHVDGPLSEMGIELLREFERLGMILDVTHLSDKSFFQALDLFHGPVLASHHNSRALVPGDRQLADEQIKLLIERGAVIGAALDAWMLYPGWVRGKTSPEVVSLEAVADHIDHVCQLAGNARHSAIGSDLDGGFGNEQTPRDLRAFSDLHKLEGILAGRGYSSEDIDGIFHGNWLGFFRKALPAS
jgi:membrane dipeptidase